MDGSAETSAAGFLFAFLETVDFPSKDQEVTKLTLKVLADNLITVRCTCGSVCGVLCTCALALARTRSRWLIWNLEIWSSRRPLRVL